MLLLILLSIVSATVPTSLDLRFSEEKVPVWLEIPAFCGSIYVCPYL
jgi:hypothetical protein